MANYNLTSQNIKDTYQQLVQVSGSALVDGTGSLVTDFDYVSTSTFNAFSASISSSVDSKVSTTTFLAYTSSTSASLSSIETQIAQLEAGSGSASWDLITGKPDGLVSSSAQVDLSLATGTAANATNATNADNIALSADSTNTNRYVSFTATANGDGTLLTDAGLLYNSFSNTLTTTTVVANVTGDLTGNADTATSATTATSASYATNADTLDGLQASAFARLAVDNNFTGTQNFDNISVSGTASIAYLQSVTGSAKVIGDAFIILNAATPSQRYAGVKVYDSGSSPVSTGSFQWDSENNDWFYEYQKDATDYAVALFGPEFDTKGTPTYPTSNVIQKGTGGHHLTGSNITDDGLTVTVSTPLSASAMKLTSGGLTFADGTTQTTKALGGLVSGTGTDSIRSSDNLTTIPAAANNVRSIAIGDNAQSNSSFGYGSDNISIGSRASTGGGTGVYAQIAIGSGSSCNGDAAIAIGRGADAGPSQDMIAIGDGARAGFGTPGGGISIGSSAKSDQRGIAIGIEALAKSSSAVAVGYKANVVGDYSLAIELGTTFPNATGVQTINIGKDINNQNGYSTAIGHNLTNNGTGGNVLIGRSITTSGDYSIGIGEGAQASSQGGIAIGNSANSAGNSVAIGAGATMGNSYGFAGGYNARANNDASIAIGGDINVSSNQAIGIGTDTTIDGSSRRAVALGQDADIATSEGGITLGGQAKVTGATGGIAIGWGSSTTGAYGIAIGSGSKVTAASEINIGGIYQYNGSTAITLNSAVSASGNVEVAGQLFSPTFAGSIASSTSSIDFDNGNFATLNLTAATFLANPTNLKSGTTYTIILDSGSLISNHGSAWKFAGGTTPTYSNGTDVLTCVSDGSSLYATALTNFS
jgi:hypothetical protein